MTTPTRTLPLLAIALALSACGGSSEPEQPASPPPARGAQAGERPEAVATRELRAAAEEEFGAPGEEASWWGDVTKLRVDQSRAEVSTDLRDDADGAEVGGEICSSVLRLLSGDGLEDVERVVVLDRDEQTLSRCAP